MNELKNEFPSLKITGDGFSLRPFSRADIPELPKYGNNLKIALNMRDIYPYPLTENDAQKFIERVCDNQPPTHFIIENDFEVIGTFAVLLKEDVYRYNAEIGYWLGEPYWGKGIMTKVISTMVPWIFGYYNIRRVYAEVFSPNVASMRALEKAGLNNEAVIRKNVFKNGQFVDTHVYAIMKDDQPRK